MKSYDIFKYAIDHRDTMLLKKKQRRKKLTASLPVLATLGTALAIVSAVELSDSRDPARLDSMTASPQAVQSGSTPQPAQTDPAKRESAADAKRKDSEYAEVTQTPSSHEKTTLSTVIINGRETAVTERRTAVTNSPAVTAVSAKLPKNAAYTSRPVPDGPDTRTTQTTCTKNDELQRETTSVTYEQPDGTNETTAVESSSKAETSATAAERIEVTEETTAFGSDKDKTEVTSTTASGRPETGQIGFSDIDEVSRVFPEFDSWDRRHYLAGRIRTENLGKLLYDFDLYGIDGSYVKALLYKINGISDNFAAALTLHRNSYIYFNTNYSPDTLGELVSDLDMQNGSVLKTVITDTFSTDSFDRDMLKGIIFSNANACPCEASNDAQAISITCSFPELGTRGGSLRINSNGVLTANIVGRSFSFLVGEDVYIKVKEFMEIYANN